jgi:hypothetical protein
MPIDVTWYSVVLQVELSYSLNFPSIIWMFVSKWSYMVLGTKDIKLVNFEAIACTKRVFALFIAQLLLCQFATYQNRDSWSSWF